MEEMNKIRGAENEADRRRAACEANIKEMQETAEARRRREKPSWKDCGSAHDRSQVRLRSWRKVFFRERDPRPHRRSPYRRRSPA